MRGACLLLGILVVGSGCVSDAPASTANPPAPFTLTPDIPIDVPVGQPAIVHALGAVALHPSAYAGELPVMAQRDIPNRPAAEPTIAVTPKGTILNSLGFDATGLRDAPSDLPFTALFRTNDEGQSWTEVTPRTMMANTPPASLDPYVHADPITQRIFSAELFGACTWVSWTDDVGDTWERSAACGDPVQDHQTLFTGKPAAGTSTNGYASVVYLCANQFAASVVCVRSLDGGLTWLPAVPVYVEPTGDSRFIPGDCGFVAHGHGATSPVDGTVYLPHNYCDQALVEVSRDSGQTWERVLIDATKGASPDGIDNHEGNVAVDAAGNAYALWAAGDGLPYLSVSRDQGRTWSEPRLASAPGITASRFPTLVAGDEGRVAVLYIGTNVTGGLDASSQANETAEWHAYVGFTLNALDEQPVFATTTANPLSDPLRRGSCSGRCGEGTNLMYDFIDLQIHPETGQVWAALVDVCVGPCAKPGAGTAPGGTLGAAGVQLAGTTLRAPLSP